jgi:hypothetical protein
MIHEAEVRVVGSCTVTGCSGVVQEWKDGDRVLTWCTRCNLVDPVNENDRPALQRQTVGGSNESPCENTRAVSILQHGPDDNKSVSMLASFYRFGHIETGPGGDL